MGEKMTQNILFNFNVHSNSLGGKQPNDEWSRDSYQYFWQFEGIKFGEGKYSTKIDNYQPDQKIYAIYVIYSTGDSFGNDIDNNCEVIGATHDYDIACKVRDFINQDYKKNGDEYIAPKLYNIEGIKFYTYPWMGMFESLSYVHVRECKPLG